MKRLWLPALVLAIAAIGASAAASPRSSTPVTLRTSSRVLSLAADGQRAAVVVARGPKVLLWGPRRHRVTTFRSEEVSSGCPLCLGPVALAGTRVAWFEESGGLTLKDAVVTATPARRMPLQLGAGFPPREVLQGPVGDGRLIVFTYGFRCDEEDEEGCPPGKHTGDIVGGTLWRTALRGECPSDDYSDSGHCARIASADGELAPLAVDAGRIAARTDQGVRLLTASGRLLRDLPVAKVRAAALSGNRLALRVPGAVEIYDTGSGGLVQTYPAQAKVRLADLEGDILVTAMGRMVTLRRISDGRSATIRARGWAQAQLEAPGLFVAGARRVTFTPMVGVQRMLGGAES